MKIFQGLLGISIVKVALQNCVLLDLLLLTKAVDRNRQNRPRDPAMTMRGTVKPGPGGCTAPTVKAMARVLTADKLDELSSIIKEIT